MEEELKTLKDLKWFTFCTYVPGKIGNAGMDKIAHKVFTEGDLKEAAIAHAKNIQQFKAEHTINFIKHFFNLTEEDLK